MPKKKKIFALMTDAFGGSGGIACANRDLLQALHASEEVDEILVIPRHAGPYGDDATPNKVRQVKAVSNRIAYSLNALWIFLTRGPYQLIFCGHLYMSPLAALLSQWSGVPCWLNLFGIEAWGKPKKRIMQAVSKIKLITALSRFTRRQAIGWMANDPDDVVILPATVNADFRPAPKQEVFLERYGLQGKKILLTVGRLSSLEKYKGHELIIDAMPALIQQCKELTYAIAGDGDDRSRLETIVRNRNLQEHVLFLGALPETDMIRLYQSADLFVMPSSGEGFGIVYLEAMASGLRAMGLGKDGSADPLHDGQLGCIATKQDLSGAMLDGLKKQFTETEKAALSAKVRHYFGKDRFQSHVKQIVRTLFHDKA